MTAFWEKEDAEVLKPTLSMFHTFSEDEPSYWTVHVFIERRDYSVELGGGGRSSVSRLINLASDHVKGLQVNEGNVQPLPLFSTLLLLLP